MAGSVTISAFVMHPGNTQDSSSSAYMYVCVFAHVCQALAMEREYMTQRACWILRAECVFAKPDLRTWSMLRSTLLSMYPVKYVLMCVLDPEKRF